jgi:predicted nucleic acid-binding protein
VTTDRGPAPVVIDASIGVAFAWDEPASREVAARLSALRSEGHRLLVPSVFWLEVMNVLGRRYRVEAPELLEALVELEAVGLETVELDRPMLLLALDAVVRHGLTAYDASYLAVAEVADARLLTGDTELAAAAGRRALPISRRRPIREAAGRYRAATAEWAAWPGAEAYLRELRARVLLPAPSGWWTQTHTGEPMPNVLGILTEQRSD